MNWRTRVFIACACAAIVAGSAFAQLSTQYRDWANGPVNWIMTPEESAQWKRIRSDADAQAFIDLFWARRDPTPGTPANEFRQAFDARVAYADAHFGEGRKKGSLTDRGRVLVVLGEPYQIVSATRPGQGTTQTPSMGVGRSTLQDHSPRQLWVYEQSRTKIALGQPRAEVTFVDQYASNQWTLERQALTPIDNLMKRTVSSYVVQPNLTEAPTYTTAAQTTQTTEQQLPPQQSAPAAAPGLTTPSLVAAVEQMRGEKATPSRDLSIIHTEMLTPTGEFFVPVQLYIPKSAKLTADSVTTFFGVLEDNAGTRVATFEEPATLSTSKGDLYFDKSLDLEPGTYRATLGLAGADGKPVVMTTRPIEVRELSPATAGISRLVLSTDIHQTDEAAVIGAPYAFGRVKIVPKGDRVFSNRDEINYFVQVINPAIDAGTNMPKIQVKLELVPKAAGGRAISAPPADAVALPLTGAPGPGQYAVMAAIPLGNMKTPPAPGEYTFRITVYDQVGKQNWKAEQDLTLVAAPQS